ncbi:ABC transporter ATP-binding protein [Nocardia sp. NPDC127579]|uniref:ABC transporter ATP-binding protein n=1 Tax=Nocardia sp. NPDC127579 TaxID=3345402 RepID=UPI0036438954
MTDDRPDSETAGAATTSGTSALSDRQAEVSAAGAKVGVLPCDAGIDPGANVAAAPGTQADDKGLSGRRAVAAAPAESAPREETPSAVELRSIGKVFAAGSVTALADVSLTVRAGEFVSLIGPSGCGKSTLLRIVADLETPSSGTVTVHGKTARQARIDQDYGIAFQQAGLLDWRTVQANVELPLELRKVPKAERRRRSAELLEMAGLSEFAARYPAELSGGMQQRVAIARALARKPSLLLMDEPFGALDEMTRERMQGELLSITEETGAAVVFVTHSIPEAVFLSDRVVVMSPRPGRITGIVDTGGWGRRSEDDIRSSAPFFEAVAAVRSTLHSGRELG